MLIMPTPLPDELAQSNALRTAILNGFERTADVFQYLRGRHTDMQMHYKGRLPIVALLAAELQQEPSEYARMHTMLCFRKAITAHLQHMSHGDITDEKIIRRLGLLFIRQNAYFCTRCVQEDLAFWGFSFWRRTHQLPGLDWCIKHECPLHKTSHHSTLTHLPEGLIKETQPENADSVEEALNNTYIRKYAELCCDLNDLKRPIERGPLIDSLRKRAKELNLKIERYDTKQSISSYAKQLLPASWLRKHYPKILLDKASEALDFNRTLGISHTPCKTIEYALAMTILFDDPTETLARLMSSHPYKNALLA